jgi:hypothetical protein
MQLSLSKMRQSSLPSLVLAGLGLFIIIIALWQPFGFYSGDIQEHWHIRSLLLPGFSDYNVDLGELALTRPMARILFWIAYYISPDSFLGDNLLLISLLWLKGMALLAVILRLFPRQYHLAFLIAVVAILYPIDTGVISLRIPHIHFGIAAYFFAFYGLLSYWQTNQARYLYLIAVLLTLCCFGYEIFYPIIALSPLVLLIYEKRISLRWIKVCIAWFIPSIVTVLYSLILIFGLGFGFQSAAVQSEKSLDVLLNRAVSPYTNTLYSIWNPAALRLDSQWLPLILTSTAVFFFIACLLLFLNSKSTRTLSLREATLFLVASFLLIGLGFLVLVPTNRAEYHQNYRVFLTSSVGAAAFLLLILYQIAGLSLRKWGFLLLNLLVSGFVALSINFHLNIHQQYAGILGKQEQFYEQILQSLPSFPEARTLVILPVGGTLEYEFDIPLKPHIFTPALQYLYESRDIVSFAFICGDGQTTCQIREGLLMARFDSGRLRYSADSLILYQMDADGRLSLLTSYPELPEYHIDSSNTGLIPIPRRFTTIFEHP